MKNMKQFFHIMSYVQYPFLILAAYFCTLPIIKGAEYITSNPGIFLEFYNKGLIFLGVGLSFSTLQDPSKTSFKFEKKVWKKPRVAKTFIILTMVMIVAFFLFGFLGFISEKEILTEFNSGAIVLAIGLIGYLKLLIETYENHREGKLVEKN